MMSIKKGGGFGGGGNDEDGEPSEYGGYEKGGVTWGIYIHVNGMNEVDGREGGDDGRIFWVL